MTTDTTTPRDQHASPSAGANETGTHDKISDAMAEDHARLLGRLRQGLATIGIEAALTTFHNLVLYAEAETYEPPSRYEPEMDVFWPGERPGIALRVKLIERGGRLFYAWGVSWARTHPATDPTGAVGVIADTLQAV